MVKSCFPADRLQDPKASSSRTSFSLSKIVLLLSTAFAYGQVNTGEISGTVRDQLEGLLPGANIVAEQAGTSQKFTAQTNTAGEYLFPQLPVGVYSLRAGAASFKQSAIPTLEVHLGEKLRYDFTLQLGDSNTTVTVEADPDVQLESAEIKDVIENRRVVSLPLKGRQFLDLAMLSEGVVRPPGGTRGDALQQAGTLVNVLGQRSGHNLYLVDGVTVTDEHFNNMVIAPSVDSIQEFAIQKTSYAPEFGGKSGAVINVATKSGTDQFHGSLFEFVRNDIFDAKNFVDSATAAIPPFRQNQFGCSFGGPVVRGRTFFFLTYEGQRIRKSLTQTFSVPAAGMRNGDFSGLAPIYDPLTGNQRQAFSDNRIPAQRLDPAAMAMLSHIPLPNLGGNGLNLRETQTQWVDTNTYSGRLDHQFTSRDNSFFPRILVRRAAIRSVRIGRVAGDALARIRKISKHSLH
jgi:hypothetical protein